MDELSLADQISAIDAALQLCRGQLYLVRIRQLTEAKETLHKLCAIRYLAEQENPDTDQIYSRLLSALRVPQDEACIQSSTEVEKNPSPP